MQEYIEAVHARIEENENTVRKYSADIMMDTEGIKDFTRKYVGQFFEEQQLQCDKLAKVCVFLTESILLEQGISASVMKAE